jgi:hypothetical protein
VTLLTTGKEAAAGLNPFAKETASNLNPFFKEAAANLNPFAAKKDTNNPFDEDDCSEWKHHMGFVRVKQKVAYDIEPKMNDEREKNVYLNI